MMRLPFETKDVTLNFKFNILECYNLILLTEYRITSTITFILFHNILILFLLNKLFLILCSSFLKKVIKFDKFQIE